MLNTQRATRGMVVAPHALAAQAGQAVLREGGNAIEATVAVAATLAVVYPHMTGLGGDSFWLLSHPGHQVQAIAGAGRTPFDLDIARYRDAGYTSIPTRGPWAANTVAGTLSGWDAALAISAREWGGRLPLSALLRDAIDYAEHGYPITDSQARITASKQNELRTQTGFAAVFLQAGKPPTAGSLQFQPALAASLKQLARAGLEDFYRGELAQSIAADLAASGSPVTIQDLNAQRNEPWQPLQLDLPGVGRYYTTAPPTQGLATLYILGQYSRRAAEMVDDLGADYVHYLAEATKQAFRVRDREVRDPQDMSPLDLAQTLSAEALQALADRIDMRKAMPWAGAGDMSDTTWFGVIDGEGRIVSCIQSLYHEFGSGIVLPQSGICWQNRGASFVLDETHPRALQPRRLPFHTLCPSLVHFNDGRRMALGTMGGDGQPQTQSCVFTRYAYLNRPLQAAITQPRWVLGRTWGQNTNTLKLEARFSSAVIDSLRERGHEVEVVADFDEMMGHAGALVRHPNGVVEAAADPRSDGAAIGF
ncbi:MAG: gamma-glutamyltransferase [Gammaproteobacteria bacterium]|nr:gamma-glutamyltransferase [Gammaproteobacteria bacterium]